MPSLEVNSSIEQGRSKMIFETQCITQKSKEVKSRYQVHCFLDNSLWNQPPTHLPATERSQNSSVPMRSSVIEQQTRFCQKHLLNRSYQRICRQIKSPSNKKKAYWSRPKLSSLLEDVATTHPTASSSCSHWRKKTSGMTWMWCNVVFISTTDKPNTNNSQSLPYKHGSQAIVWGSEVIK